MTTLSSLLLPEAMKPRLHQPSDRMQQWLDSHDLAVVAARSDELSFGSFSVTVSDGLLLTRFTSDRDGFLVEVGLGYRWYRLRTVWAFTESGTTEAAAQAPDWPMIDPYEHRDRLVAALRAPELPRFAIEVDKGAFAALGLHVVK